MPRVDHYGPLQSHNLKVADSNPTPATAAFERLSSGKLGEGESVPELRASLLSYCEIDTWAMVEVHRTLMMMF